MVTTQRDDDSGPFSVLTHTNALIWEVKKWDSHTLPEIPACRLSTPWFDFSVCEHITRDPLKCKDGQCHYVCVLWHEGVGAVTQTWFMTLTCVILKEKEKINLPPSSPLTPFTIPLGLDDINVHFTGCVWVCLGLKSGVFNSPWSAT